MQSDERMKSICRANKRLNRLSVSTKRYGTLQLNDSRAF